MHNINPFWLVADAIAENSSGAIEVMFEAEDCTDYPPSRQAHFLKWNGNQLGGDLELYSSLILDSDWRVAVMRFIDDVLCPLDNDRTADAYSAGVIMLRKIFENKNWFKRLEVHFI